MADYDGGRVFLQVVPSFRGVQTLISGQASKWGRDAGREFDRAFDREVGRSHTRLGPSSTESRKQGTDAGGAFADGFRRRVEAAMRSLPPAKLKADATEAERTIRDLRLHLQELSGKTIGVDIDSAAAMAEIERIDQQLDELGRESADIQVRADTAAARAQLAHIHAQVNDLDRDDVNIDVDVDTAGGLASLNSFSGRLVLLATLIAGLAPAAVPALGAIAVALAGIGTAAIVGLGGVIALAIGFNGIFDAVKALGEVQKSAADDAEKASARHASAARSLASAQRQLESAERGLANARANAADQAEDAARRVAAAQEAVADAERDAVESAEDSVRRVADARDAMADATEDAADAIADALRRQGDAEEALADAQENTRQAQLNLTRARMDAREALEDLAFSTRSAALAEEDAELGLARARERLAETLAEGVGGLDLQEAELAVRQAELRLDRATDRNRDAQAEAAAAEAAGVDGAQAVLDAQRRLSESREAEIDRAERLRSAEQAVVDARVAGAELVADAQERLTDALVAQERQQIDTAQRIVDAQERVAEAVRGQERQQRQSAFAIAGALASVEGAQAAIAAAAVNTGDVGSTAMNKLEESMNALSPAGQAFARFLFNLKPAWDALKGSVESALFPGITAGIEAMLPKLPAIIGFISALAGVMGTLAQEAGEALAGPEWEAFFGYLASDGPGILLTLGRAFGDFALGVGNLLVAFAPLTDLFITGIGNMAETFANWSAGLAENEGFRTFFDYISDTIPDLLDFFGDLGDLVVALIKSMAPFGPVVLKIVGAFARLIAALPPGVLSALVLAFIGFTTVMSILGPLIGVVVTGIAAFNAGATVTGAVIAALGGPVTLIILGIVALGAALVAAYHHSETFRAIVDGAFAAVGAAASWLWNEAIRPSFEAISGFVTGTLGPAVTDLWNKVIKPAFEGIGSVISFVWENVVKRIFDAYVFYLQRILAPAVLWLWREVIEPAWKGIQIAIDVAWALIQIPLNLFKAFVTEILAPIFTWLWHEVIERAFNGISTVISTVWEEGIKPILEALGGFIEDTVAPAFQRGVDAIGRIWETIREIAKKPVRFIIETIINDGIIGTFNWIAGKVPGVDKIDPVKLPKGFATGGIYPGYTPGRDIGYIGVSGGEAIMRPEWTRVVGAERIEQMNAVARAGGISGVRRYLGGFAFGGVVDSVKGGVDWAKEGVGGVVGSVVGAAKDFVIGNLRKAARAALQPFLDRLDEFDGGMIGDLLTGGVHKLVDGILGFAGDKDTEGGGSLEGGSFGRSSAGWPKAIRGVLSSNTAAAIAFVREMFGLRNVGGLGQRSNKSDHPMGKALDAMIPNWQDPAGISLGNQLASWFVNNPDAFGTKYLIWRDKVNSGSGWRPYVHPSGNTTNPTLRHLDHVHASLFDQGGRLPRGLSTVMNATGRPELVLNGQQESMIEAVLRQRIKPDGGGRDGQLFGDVIVQDPVDVDILMRRAEFAVQGGRL